MIAVTPSGSQSRTDVTHRSREPAIGSPDGVDSLLQYYHVPRDRDLPPSTR
jgi:hypothetical protein